MFLIGFQVLLSIGRDVLFLARQLPPWMRRLVAFIWLSVRCYGAVLRDRARCRRLLAQMESERLSRIRNPDRYRGRE